jgi:hypothetical protein
VTPLLGADGEVYAVAQGQLAVSGFTAQGASGTTITKGVPTSGRISSGAIIEREIEFELAAMKNVNIALRNPDFTTARRIAVSINSLLGSNFAALVDPGTVALRVPNAYRGRVADLLTDIEQLMVDPDMPARVVIDETTGVIVMGKNVRINTIAIAHGNLTIQVSETPQVSQPGAFSPAGAATTTVQRSEISVDDGSDNYLTMVPDGIAAGAANGDARTARLTSGGKIKPPAARQRVGSQQHHIQRQFSGAGNLLILGAVIGTLPGELDLGIGQHRGTRLHGAGPIHRAVMAAIGETEETQAADSLAGTVGDQLTRILHAFGAAFAEQFGAIIGRAHRPCQIVTQARAQQPR